MVKPTIKHIAIIPDGNRRWARRNSLEVLAGHNSGAKAIENVLREALRLGISYITIWGLSVDNIVKRTKPEVNFLFTLVEREFRKLLTEPLIAENRVRVRVIGRWKEFFPESLQAVVHKVVAKTESHANSNLTFLLAYNGIDEMVDAVGQIAARGEIATAEIIRNNLWTRDLPPVDLVVRTGGEPHWSGGFMMWHVADAHLYFTDTLWPDFGAEEFRRAIEQCASRDRRFGK